MVLEKTFKIPIPDVQTASYKTWESLINNFALDKNLLVSAKRIKLLMQPLTSAKNYNEETNLARFDAWWHLAFRMEEKLHSEFSTVSRLVANFLVRFYYSLEFYFLGLLAIIKSHS